MIDIIIIAVRNYVWKLDIGFTPLCLPILSSTQGYIVRTGNWDQQVWSKCWMTKEVINVLLQLYMFYSYYTSGYNKNKKEGN